MSRPVQADLLAVGGLLESLDEDVTDIMAAIIQVDRRTAAQPDAGALNADEGDAPITVHDLFLYFLKVGPGMSLSMSACHSDRPPVPAGNLSGLWSPTGTLRTIGALYAPAPVLKIDTKNGVDPIFMAPKADPYGERRDHCLI